MPDSIITNRIWRSLVLGKPKVRPIEVASESIVLKILNTIKPVTKAFTAMEMNKAVTVNVTPQEVIINWTCTNSNEPNGASQVARGNKLKSIYILLNEGRLTDLSMRLPKMKE